MTVFENVSKSKQFYRTIYGFIIFFFIPKHKNRLMPVCKANVYVIQDMLNYILHKTYIDYNNMHTDIRQY